MDPAERWKRHWPALVAAMLVGLVIVNLSPHVSTAIWWGMFAAYTMGLFVVQKLGAFGR